MDSGTRKGRVLTGGYPPETAKNRKTPQASQ